MSAIESISRAQLARLKECAQEPQHTFGKHRVRVQNILVELGLARYGTIDPNKLYEERCFITDAGRAVLAGVAAGTIKVSK